MCTFERFHALPDSVDGHSGDQVIESQTRLKNYKDFKNCLSSKSKHFKHLVSYAFLKYAITSKRLC